MVECFAILTVAGSRAMTWGEMQSVIQLAAALNAIYLALRDVRNPYVRSEEKALTQISSTIRERIGAATENTEKQYLREIASLANNVNATFGGAMREFDKKDSRVGLACVVFVFLYIILLIISGFFRAYPVKADTHYM